MTQMQFVDSIVARAKKDGKTVRINRNGDLQIDFDHKSLTAHHLRLVYQDIVRKSGSYTRDDLDLIAAGRPCAKGPFFELAVGAGLCVPVKIDGRTIYKFGFAQKQPGRGGKKNPTRQVPEVSKQNTSPVERYNTNS